MVCVCVCIRFGSTDPSNLRPTYYSREKRKKQKQGGLDSSKREMETVGDGAAG